MKSIPILIRKIVSLLFFAFSCFNSCTTDPVLINSEQLSEHYIYSIISPNKSTQQVIVGKVIPETMPIDISEALVEMINQDSYIILSETNPGIYQDTEKELNISPGDSCSLNVRFPDSHIMHGITAVPGSFHFVNNSSDDTLEYILYNTDQNFIDNYKAPEISWTKSKNALKYELSIFKLNQDFLMALETTEDTSIVMPLIEPLYFFEYDTTLTTMDFNAILEVKSMNYYSKYPSNDNSNVRGGKGFLGAYYSISDTLTIRIRKE